MSSNIEELRLKKQLYLKTQIIDKSYSAEEFSDFLVSKRENGANIDKWTIDELVNVVNEFKKVNQPDSDEEVSENQKENQNIDSKVNVPSIKQIKSPAPQYIDSPLKKIQLAPCDNTLSTMTEDLFIDQPEVKVESVEAKSKNLFGTRFVYKLFTPIYGWRVDRRESDFRWLVDRLRREYPLIKLDYPEKKGLSCDKMEFYLNNLISNKQVLKSNFLLYWLSYPNKDKFYERKSKEFKNNFLDDIQVKLHATFDQSLVKKILVKAKQEISSKPSEHQKVSQTESGTNPAKEIQENIDTSKNNTLQYNDSADGEFVDTPVNISQINADLNPTKKVDNIDYQAFLQDLRDSSTKNSVLLNKVHQYTKDVCFIVDQLKSKQTNLADAFSEITRNYTSLSINKINEFEDITPPISKIMANQKLSLFTYGNIVNNTKTSFDQILKPAVKHFIDSHDSLNASLKKQSNLTTKLAHTINKKTSLHEDEINATVIKVFGNQNFSEVVHRRQRRLKELNKKCFGQFLTVYKNDQEELMRGAINFSINMGKVVKDEEKCWNDLLEVFKA